MIINSVVLYWFFVCGVFWVWLFVVTGVFAGLNCLDFNCFAFGL